MVENRHIKLLKFKVVRSWDLKCQIIESTAIDQN